MADPNAGIDEIIANTYEGLGFHARAAMMRYGTGIAVGDTPDLGLIDAIVDLLDEVPTNTGKHSCVDDAPAVYGTDGKATKAAVRACWRTRAQCLADRIRALIDSQDA